MAPLPPPTKEDLDEASEIVDLVLAEAEVPEDERAEWAPPPPAGTEG
jgi:hypothetical protein